MQLRRELGGQFHAGRVEEILVLVIVELARGQNLARRGGLRLVIAQHRAFDFGAGDGAFDDDLGIETRGFGQGRGEFGLVVGLGDADRGAEIGRLDEQREAEARDGRSRVQRSSHGSSRRNVIHSTTGRPRAVHRRLNCSLSIDAAEANTPAPT